MTGCATRPSSLRRPRLCPTQAGDLDLQLALPDVKSARTIAVAPACTYGVPKPRRKWSTHIREHAPPAGAREGIQFCRQATQSHGACGAVRGHADRANGSQTRSSRLTPLRPSKLASAGLEPGSLPHSPTLQLPGTMRNCRAQTFALHPFHRSASASVMRVNR